MKMCDDLVYTCENVSNMHGVMRLVQLASLKSVPTWAAIADSVFKAGGDAEHPETDDVAAGRDAEPDVVDSNVAVNAGETQSRNELAISTLHRGLRTEQFSTRR